MYFKSNYFKLRIACETNFVSQIGAENEGINMKPAVFQAKLADQGIVLSGWQQEQFAVYYRLLVTTNRQVNLTALTAESDVYLKHFYDSLIPSLILPQLQQKPLMLCDVGAGAGFPSIPLKIAFPQLHITIVDSLNKRINFLHELVSALNLSNVELYHARAEEFGARQSEFREKFDVVTARAVASLNVLSELCLPLTKVGGKFVALKAKKAPEEIAAATAAIKLLGGRVATDQTMVLPETNDLRHVIVVDKIAATPTKYPRKPGVPNKKPLDSVPHKEG